MNDFNSLQTVLVDWFDTPLKDLPRELRQRIQNDLFPLPWDSLSSEQRRSAASQWDQLNDPVLAEGKEYWWNLYTYKTAIEREIETLKGNDADPNAADSRERLVGLENILRHLKRALSHPEDAKRARETLALAGIAPTGEYSYVVADTPYPKALRLLTKYLQATPDEIAAWVFLGPKLGGLAAYTNANELDQPPRFHFDAPNADEHDFDYLPPLMGLWFCSAHLDSFEPGERFLTGRALMEKWREVPGIDPEAFIRAKIAESRLQDIHPVTGLTQGSCPGDDSFPPIAHGLFSRSEIKAIEALDFGGGELGKVVSPSITADRDTALQDVANTIAKQWKLNNRKRFSKRDIAEKLAQSDEWGEMKAIRIERILRKEW